MLILGKNEISEIFTMKDSIVAVKKAFEIYSKGEADVPLRTRIDIEKNSGVSLFMPGYVSDIDLAGIKIVGVFPNNREYGKPVVPANMILIDVKSGEVCCMMDGTYLTELRTGAASGAATDMLARKDSKIATVIGTGGQALSQVEAILAVRDIEELRVCGRDFEKTKRFSYFIKESLGVDIDVVAYQSIEKAIKNADIVTAVTTSDKPVFDGNWISRGTHVNGVGSYTANMQELDEHLMINADKIFVDSKTSALAEAGDLVIPINSGLISEAKIAGEIGELLAGSICGRENPEEITVFKTVGMAVLDIVTAGAIYKKAMELGIGRHIEL